MKGFVLAWICHCGTPVWKGNDDGRCPFCGEFNPESRTGRMIAREEGEHERRRERLKHADN